MGKSGRNEKDLEDAFYKEFGIWNRRHARGNWSWNKPDDIYTLRKVSAGLAAFIMEAARTLASSAYVFESLRPTTVLSLQYVTFMVLPVLL